MKNKPFPDILKRRYWSWRWFKSIKRDELRDVARVFEPLHTASAFLPKEAYEITDRMRRDMDELKGLLSVKKWGR